MKKYKLIKKDSVELYGRTLYRVKALRDFGDVKKGDVGGYIEKESNLSHEGDCWVYDSARVYGNAKVYGNARVFDKAWVSGTAKVFDKAWVYGNAEVFDNAWVYGNAKVSDNAMVSGNTWVFENAKVFDNARVFENARVFGNAKVYGNARVSGNAWVYGNAICSKTPLNLIGLKYDITITDNYVKVGCMQWLKKDVDSVKYKDVKDENITLGEFRYIKSVIKIHLKGYKNENVRPSNTK